MQLIKLANNVQIETKERRVFAFDQTKNSDKFYKTFLNPQVATKLARLTLKNFFHSCTAIVGRASRVQSGAG